VAPEQGESTPVPEAPGAAIVPPPALAAPIPEPGIWAMLILGFWAVGAAIRVRLRRTECASPARS
jgi:hypothetical protein